MADCLCTAEAGGSPVGSSGRDVRDLSGSLPGLFFIIHAAGSTAANAAYHTALQEIAPAVPEVEPISFRQFLFDSIATQQLLSVLSGFFALLGLLLSGIGIC